jgi:hypothetical protein
VTRTNGSKQRFCCGTHRKLYWQYGTLTFEKLLERVRREVPHLVGDASIPAAITKRLEALERRLDAIASAAQKPAAV